MDILSAPANVAMLTMKVFKTIAKITDIFFFSEVLVLKLTQIIILKVTNLVVSLCGMC